MQKNLIYITMIAFIVGCQSNQRLATPEATATSQVAQPSPTEIKSIWSVYDPDPGHPWNRVFRQLYERIGPNGEEVGADELDPLLWFDTTYLLIGDSHQQALQVLDEFLSTHAENLIQDSLKRAMFQRDLWAVFDWLASQMDIHPAARIALEVRLTEIIKRVALPEDEILSLPDNYALAVRSKDFPVEFQPDQPETAFLPPDIFQPESAWVPMGREGGPIAMTHTEAFPFFGRSVFLVFVRSPDGRAETLDFIESLNTKGNPVTAAGTEVALVRRMLLIDDQGELVVSPLIETIQIRHFSPIQNFYEFELDRRDLFDGSAGGLIPNSDLFMLFMSHGDVFQIPELPTLQATIPDICKVCHAEDPSVFRGGNTKSIVSYSRQPFPLLNNERPALFATTWMDGAQTVVAWKQNHETWRSLQSFWEQRSP